MTVTHFVTSDAVGLVGRSTKATVDVERLVFDFSRWLDSGETLTSAGSFSMIVASSVPAAVAWQTDYPFEPAATAVTGTDTTPLILTGATASGTTANVFLSAGTPKLTYIVSFIVTTSTGRQKEVDVLLTIAEQVNTNMVSSLNPTPTNGFIVVTGTFALALNFAGTVFVQNGAGAPITITLPPTPVVNQTVDAIDASGNASTNVIHFVGAAGVLINGFATYDFSVDNQSASFRWTGTQWVVV